MTALAGLYRGVVVNNVDPLARRRVLVQVADVTPAPTWAEACVPPGSRAKPAIGSGVWVQFENGDARYRCGSAFGLERPTMT